MMRRCTVLVLLTLLVTPAMAGTASDPEVTDPRGDQTVTISGGLAVLDPSHDFNETDITAAWMTDDNRTLRIHVATNEPIDDGNASVVIQATFTINKGPNSLPNTTASGQSFEARVNSTLNTTGPANTTASIAGNVTTISIPFASINATGGDEVRSLVIETAGQHTGRVEVDEELDDVDLDGETGRDRAPNSGSGATYTLSRPPIVPGLAFAVEGGTTIITTDRNDEVVFAVNVTNTGTDIDTVTLRANGTAMANATVNPTTLNLNPGQKGRTFVTVSLDNATLGSHEVVLNATSTRGGSLERTLNVTVRDVIGGVELSIDGPRTVFTRDPNQTLDFTLVILNTGSDFDTVNLAASVAGSATATIETDMVSLAPNAEERISIQLALNDAANGIVNVTIEAASDNGGTDSITFGAEVQRPGTGGNGASGERDPVIGGFLTPMAEAMGFDEVFGDWAEVALLALLLLLLILLIFLILFLIGSKWVKVEAAERKARVAPGNSAEFRVAIDHARKEAGRIKARLRGTEPSWATEIRLEHQDGDDVKTITNDEGEVEFDLGAKKTPDAHADTIIRVDVPDDALDKDRNRLELDIVPLDESGVERPGKGKTLNLDVRAAGDGSAGKPIISLDEITHDPAEPEEGQTVTTVAKVRNGGSRPWDLNVNLVKDGETIEARAVTVQPYTALDVAFQWVADKGNNKVKVQVFEA